MTKIREGLNFLQCVITTRRYAVQPSRDKHRCCCISAPTTYLGPPSSFVSESQLLVPWAICTHPKKKSRHRRWLVWEQFKLSTIVPGDIHFTHTTRAVLGNRMNKKQVHILEGLQRSLQFQNAVSQYPLSAFCFSFARSSGEGWERSESRWSWLRKRPLKTSSSGALLRWSSASRANMSSLSLLGVSESYSPVTFPW